MTTRGSVATAGLLAPPAQLLDDQMMVRIRVRLESGVAGAVAESAPDEPIEIGLPMLRRTRYRPERLGVEDEPFAWKPEFVRRSLGLEVVRVCAEGCFRGPAAAVGPVVDRALADWRRSGHRTFHWEPWLAGLGAGARAVVLAGAVTWATSLWATFDWPVLRGGTVLGGPDDRWTGPGSVVLRGRTEARIGPAHVRPAFVSVVSGCPGDGWRSELGFLALVAALAAPERPAASRVVGIWPEAGYRLAVEVDEALLAAAVDRVVDAVAVTADVRAMGLVTDVA